MKNTFFKNWWLLLVKGILVVALGIMSFIMPHITILVLTTWFGALMVLVGILSLATLFASRKELGRGSKMQVLEGVMDIFFGLLILLFPQITVLVFAVIVGIWLIFVGILQLIFSLLLRPIIKNWWLFLLNGLITTILGGLIGFNPLEGTITLSYLIGITAIFFGLMLITGSFFLKQMRNVFEEKSY